jgi:hypothetical protein
MSTTTQDTNNQHTRHTHRELQLRSPRIPKGLVSFLHSAFLLLRLEMTAGKAPVMVRWGLTSPTTLTFPPPPQPILPSTRGSTLIPLIPIPLYPIHAVTLANTILSITRINYLWVGYIHTSVEFLHIWRPMVLPRMLEAK